MKTRNYLNGCLFAVITAIMSLSCYKSNNDYNNGGGNSYTVSIKSSGFTPATLTVVVGSIVTWKNDDAMTHAVTSADGSINSGDIAAGASFSKTFSNTGTFNYYDAQNNSMTGVITITASPGGY